MLENFFNSAIIWFPEYLNYTSLNNQRACLVFKTSVRFRKHCFQRFHLALWAKLKKKKWLAQMNYITHLLRWEVIRIVLNPSSTLQSRQYMFYVWESRFPESWSASGPTAETWNCWDLSPDFNFCWMDERMDAWIKEDTLLGLKFFLLLFKGNFLSCEGRHRKLR